MHSTAIFKKKREGVGREIGSKQVLVALKMKGGYHIFLKRGENGGMKIVQLLFFFFFFFFFQIYVELSMENKKVKLQ